MSVPHFMLDPAAQSLNYISVPHSKLTKTKFSLLPWAPLCLGDNLQSTPRTFLSFALFLFFF